MYPQAQLEHFTDEELSEQLKNKEGIKKVHEAADDRYGTKGTAENEAEIKQLKEEIAKRNSQR